jgi:hypothetical protein
MRHWISLCLIARLPGLASAGVPTPPTWPSSCSRIPSRIVLVGTNGIDPDQKTGDFEVTVCRFTNTASGATVSVGTSQDGVRIGSWSDPPPVYFNCASPVVRAFADADGVCHMTVTGSVDLSKTTPGISPTVQIFANGVLFGEVPVVCYDLDGVGGVGAGDLALWLQIFGSGDNLSVADYDGDGRVDASDLSMWLEVFGSGREAVSATPSCP